MDKETIDKIYNIKNYIKESFKSDHWKLYYKNKLDNFDISKIENFRQNSLSDGLDNSRLITIDLLERKINNFKDTLKKFGLSFENVYHLFINENIGNNSCYINFKGRYVDMVQLNHVILYLLLKKYCFVNQNYKNILEVGAGFGNLARIIIENYKCKYFIIDLPESLILQAYFLKKFFPEKKICFPEDVDGLLLKDEHVQKYDIFLLPPSIKILTNLNLDCAINSGSFMEMKKRDIREYFHLIEKNLRKGGFFFNNNRYFKDTSGEKIRLYEYPYNKKCKVIYSNQYLYFYRLHTLITKKIDVETNEIEEELSKIEKLTKNHEYPNFMPIRLMRIYQSIKKFLKIRTSEI